MFYSFGYQGLKPEMVLSFLQDKDSLLFDVRLSPRSRIPGWNGDDLRRLLQDKYHHVSNLGNVNYRGGSVKIRNMDAGVNLLVRFHRLHNIALMCVCRDHATCHRSHITRELISRGYPVGEVNLHPPKKADMQTSLL